MIWADRFAVTVAALVFFACLWGMAWEPVPGAKIGGLFLFPAAVGVMVWIPLRLLDFLNGGPSRRAVWRR